MADIFDQIAQKAEHAERACVVGADAIAYAKAFREHFAPVMAKLEWSSVLEGQTSGNMGSHINVPLVRCCPWCHGVDPLDSHTSHFTEEAIGHQSYCWWNHA